MSSRARQLTILALAVVALSPSGLATSPTVKLDKCTFVGTSDNLTNSFLGIPFAKPPIGALRFNLPVPNDPYTGTHDATSFGFTCLQQSGPIPAGFGLLDPAAIAFVSNLFAPTTAQSEDCLTVNVVVPAGTKRNAKLPVVIWIYGGGFMTGGTSGYDGTVIVKRSVEIGEPIIYVSLNYRLSALGFVAGKEVLDAGITNLGLRDQRLAFRWVHKYISAFGGDPSKVTIWGESAGAVSVSMHLISNGGNTEGLFRGAFMQSGSPTPTGDVISNQPYFDQFVIDSGCSGANNVLECLRGVSTETIHAAMNKSPNIFAFQSLRLAYQPLSDGPNGFIPDYPQKLVLKGSVANVPFVTGDCDDEGTLFSLSNTNITTEAEFREYIATNYMSGIDLASKDLDTLLKLYPADPAAGSPFNTGNANALTPQYKRNAALVGDITFQAPRRFFLEHRSHKQDTYAFLSKLNKTLPDLGSVHGSDVFNIYGPGAMTDYLINFVAHLNPNGKTGIHWPKYSVATRKLMTFLDGETPLAITKDDYRAAGMSLLQKLSSKFPVVTPDSSSTVPRT